MKLKISEVKKILSAEIAWHEKNIDDRITQDFTRGFIAGIKQALYLITTAEKQVEE